MAETYTATQAIEAIKGSKGVISVIQSRLGCARQTVYNLMERYPTVKQARDDEKEALKDYAESKLFQQISKDNMTAIIFYLKTQARDRGYIERQEVTGIDGSPLTIKVIYEDEALDDDD